jgi:hypothetical protein
MDVVVPSSSLLFHSMPVSSTTVPDPTSKLVSMAVMPLGQEPEAADFKTASWMTLPAGVTARCQLLIGPASTVGELPEGVYRLWAKVTATPEIPVLPATNCLRIT